MRATERVYLADDQCLSTTATVMAVGERALALDRTCFHPGGGGQPCDAGTLRLPDGLTLPIVAVRDDDAGVLWHCTETQPSENLLGARVQLALDGERRALIARHHTVLHVLNTIVLRDHGGWITGAQIQPDYSRIDFNLQRISPELCAALERQVNAVIAGDRPIHVCRLPAAEFARRTDLLRTLEVRPPMIDGCVRVVAIEGFDAQACGGTHVPRTSAVGRIRIVRTENKGRQNKRLYVALDPP